MGKIKSSIDKFDYIQLVDLWKPLVYDPANIQQNPICYHNHATPNINCTRCEAYGSSNNAIMPDMYMGCTGKNYDDIDAYLYVAESRGDYPLVTNYDVVYFHLICAADYCNSAENINKIKQIISNNLKPILPEITIPTQSPFLQ
ncbi:unnamed protein product [Didymodactylos carnosus]|uniref:Uncharacterized protein n=1 Tax=Didymodactylos carnosus TaxID=1234261 RepID=A0A8S2RP69_9BILA|nr:unnamed protein product [Didymodactylos carnosus]CAF4172582.1 unnamed protein product [Didymodactylos carnosus]